MQLRHLLPALPPRRSSIAGVVLIVAACLLVYAPSLRNDFVLWDDPLVLYSNPIAKGPTLQNIIGAFTSFDPELYVPLTVLSYQLEYLLAGRNPFLYHFDNLLLHAANAVLVAILFYRLCRRQNMALFFGMLFALHPLNVEATVWAAARKDLLSTFFFLLSFLSYLRYREDGHRQPYVASIVFLLLSLLSKVTMAVSPGLFLLIDLLDARRIDRHALLEKAPHALLSIIFIGVALLGKSAALEQTTLQQTVLMAGKSSTFYLGTFLWPWNLSPMYPYVGEIDWRLPAFWMPWLLLLSLVCVVVATLRHTRWIAIGSAFYLLALLPTFSNFHKGEFYIASDRYVYVAMLGLFIIMASLLQRYANRLPSRLARSGHGVAALVLVVCAVLTVRQSLVWKDSDSLMSHTVRIQPTAVAALTNLAIVDIAKGRYDDAMRHLDAAEQLRPESVKIHTARANVLAKLGRMDDAIRSCKQAVTLDADDYDGHYCLAQAYHINGDLQHAVEQYQLIVSIEPRHVGAFTNLGSILIDRGDIDGAETAFRRALSVDATFAAGQFNLGVVLEQRKKYAEAIEHFRLAARYDAHNEEPLLHIVALAKELGLPEEATAAAQRIAWIRRNTPSGGTNVLDTQRSW